MAFYPVPRPDARKRAGISTVTKLISWSAGILVFACLDVTLGFNARQFKTKNRPRPRGALNLSFGVVAVEDVFNNGKSESCPPLFAPAALVDAVESLEDP